MLRRLAILPMLTTLLLAACSSAGTATADQPTLAAEPPTSAPTAATGPQAGSGGAMYQLDPAKTTASFTINEILLGQPNTVVGTTRDVKGSFSLDLGDPAGAEYGPVEINADSFVTDDDRRNGAIRRFILQTNNPDNAIVTFQPISVDGLPSSAEVGTDYEVSVTGDLTLHGITQSVTFQGQVSVASADEVQGSLSASVPRADFDLNIPSVPSVADVQETVLLKLDFVASRS